MKPVLLCATVAIAFLFGCLVTAPAYGQLYGGKGDVTTGDLNDQDYWWSKFDDMMLGLAMKQHQPEGRIGVDLASTSRRLDDLAKKYPKHEGIKGMRERVAAVMKQLDPNAERGAAFSGECPWDEANFAQLWVNMHWAKVAWDEKDYQNVQRLMQNVNQNMTIMLVPDRMKNYPPELSAYVRDAKPEAERLTKLVTDKLAPPSGKPEVKAETAVLGGDLNNQDYWWARFDDMMLDYAVRARQPEGRIDLQLVGAIKRLDDLLKAYPNHEGLKKMKQHADEIKAKIDPNADRSAPFAPEVPWEESNFAQLWVNLHHAQAAHEKKDNATAAGLLSNIRQNQEILLKPDRMKQYPPELKKWVEDSKAESEQLEKDVKAKGRR